MVGPLSNKTYELLVSIVKNILSSSNLAKDVLAAKERWRQLERTATSVDDSNYYAKKFGEEVEQIFRDTVGKQYGFESLKEILQDENHNKDLSIGDFVLRLYNGRGSILIDTKFCYTLVPGCYGGFSLNNERAFGGWNLCFSTDCDSALLLYTEYIRELVDNGDLEIKTKYRYKDYKHIVEDGIKLGYIIKVDK